MTVTIVRPDGTSLRMDATIELAFSPDIVMSEHAVDDGSSVVDMVIERGLPFTIRGVVSGTPLGLPGGVGNPRRLQDARDFLHACVGEKLTVVDPRLRPITNCLLGPFPHALTIMNGITFEISMKRVQFATTDTVRIPPERPVPRAVDDSSSDNDIGDQFVGPLPEDKVADSYAVDLLQGFGVFNPD